MEMRASEEIAIGEDLTPPVPPLAYSLSDPFLPSHCYSCFRPLKFSNNTDPIPLLSCGAHPHCPVRYCSRECSHADAGPHLSSGECRLFYLLEFDPSAPHLDDTSDLRLALRLLSLFRKLGFPINAERIGGLLTNREKFGDSEGDRLVSLARNSGERGEVFAEERAVLGLVRTNAVEVQVGDRASVGVAVYGPGFSWFNHSCRPNASYRFELVDPDDESSEEFRYRVVPSGQESMTWSNDKPELKDASCRYGPRIVTRSIKGIKKGQEVCVTYTDLLQPKVRRHSELWSKFQFSCFCHRCDASAPTYVDHVLEAYTSSTSSPHGDEQWRPLSDYLDQAYTSSTSSPHGDEQWRPLSDYLDQVIERYIVEGDPKACYESLKPLLSYIFKYEASQVEPSEPRSLDCLSYNISDNLPYGYAHGPHPQFKNLKPVKLHPLHHLSLNCYLVLASAHAVLASGELAPSSDEATITEAFEMGKAAAAYSLFLAGATHHLFLCESSLIASTAQVWVCAGESLLRVLSCLKWASVGQTIPPCTCGHSSVEEIGSKGSLSKEEFEETCKQFYGCIQRISSNVWPFLVEGIPSLKSVADPVHFSWLERKEEGNVAVGVCCEEATMRGFVHHLAAHCLLYGGWLGSICHGPNCCTVSNVHKLLPIVSHP